MKINFTKCLFVGLLVLIQTNIILSQIENNYDSKGTDFWLTFLPNFHQNPNTDSLYIFITSSEPTSGTIEYRNRTGNSFIQPFTISDPTQIYVFKLKDSNFELLGFNEGGIIRSSNQGESIALNSFHITSEKEITVYALNQAHYTSDAFMILPTDVLDKRYFILSYNSDGDGNAFGIYESSTPSQFAIVATEDSTSVTIYPSAETYVNGYSTQTINMNRGDVYLVQARIRPNQLRADLTGTEIISSKPIAVFSGHQRATVPVTLNVGSPSRDILVEQLPPVSTWGKNAIIVPLAKSRNENPYGNNLFRVLAAEDQTEVYIDGVRVTTLNSGGYYEGILNKAMFITASKPILVGVFKKTVGASGDTRVGDPFFLVMPPIEQYMNNYRVINVQIYEGNVWPVYLEQYISIIIPKSHWQSFRLDGSPLLPGNIVNINSVDYVYAIISVTDGVHYAEADTTFGIIIYGYGNANSYGYIGGSSYLNLKYFEPKIKTLQTDSCFVSKGIAYKYGARDADLVDIFTVDSVTQNAELYNKTYSKDTIFYSFRLKDIYNDGSYGLFVVDTIGLRSPLFVEWVPGFTVCADGYRNATNIPIIKDTTSVGKDICVAVNLENYGRFEQTITRAYLKNLGVTLGSITPFNVQPFSKYKLTFCLNFNRDTTIIDTLIIENDCAERKALAVEISVLADKNQPKTFAEKDTCLKYIDWVFTDSLKLDKGLLRVEVLEKTNCNIDLVAFYPKKVAVRVNIISPFEDTFYHIVAEDSVGNSIEVSDTIPGFTLQILDFDNERVYDFGSLSVGYIICDTFLLYNYGNFTLTLENIEFERNIEFSIPPSQLPIVIPPKTSVPLFLCFNPSKADLFSDTLKYTFLCSSINVPVQGEGEVIPLSGGTNCNVRLVTELQGAKNGIVSDDPFPNPAKTIVYLPIPKGIEAPVTIELFNSIGRKISSTIIPTYNSEASFVEIGISSLADGFYIISVKGSNFIHNYKFFKLY
jgi:hypothetical protein